MAILKTISGIRGTIGGEPGENLTPIDIVESTAAYGQWILQKKNGRKVVLGRDARISGPSVSALVSHTLIMLGIDVIDLGLSTTPTVEMAVVWEQAAGGIILTASHNPKEWNALKLLNARGEFISQEDGEAILNLIEQRSFNFAPIDLQGTYQTNNSYLERHIQAILNLDLVKTQSIRNKKLKIVVDGINSSGAISVPPLLKYFDCDVVVLNGETTGDFAHTPEPLPQNLTALMDAVPAHKADLGIAVDPDVDRLAFVGEDGSYFGEEYTLVAIADYVLSHTPGNTVSNLSSTRALKDVTQSHGQSYFAAAVGEVNVVRQMKKKNAVIGGEGNGGVIYPALHYGRDALVGIALFLSLMAERKKTASAIRSQYPNYFMVKNAIPLSPNMPLERIFSTLKESFKSEELNTIDGLKINFTEGWVHLRKSNTEPILRMYGEGPTKQKAEALIDKIKEEIANFVR